MSHESKIAVVTGASSGLGVDFATLLAQRGYHLILAARRADRLESIRAELENTYSISVQCVCVDLASACGADQLFEAATAGNREPGVFINNAGVAYRRNFVDDYSHVEQTLAVNLQSATKLAWLFAERMRSSGGGYILNVSSYAALLPASELAVYAATKAYLKTLSQAANAGLRKDNVSMTAICPGFFASELLDDDEANTSRLMKMSHLDRKMVARAGIKGMFNRRSLVVPGIFYKLSSIGMRLLPESAATPIANFVFGTDKSKG